ncbi:MAG: hypothetical protein AAF629_25260, partial [Chloroflexota bacterium]
VVICSRHATYGSTAASTTGIDGLGLYESMTIVSVVLADFPLTSYGLCRNPLRSPYAVWLSGEEKVSLTNKEIGHSQAP